MKYKDKKRIKRLVNNENIYKIYDTEKKLFSNGGLYPVFDETGKDYFRLQDVKKHKTQLARIKSNAEDNCVVVKIKVKVKDIVIQ